MGHLEPVNVYLGCEEYTGAPSFAAMSALKVLRFIFYYYLCMYFSHLQWAQLTVHPFPLVNVTIYTLRILIVFSQTMTIYLCTITTLFIF